MQRPEPSRESLAPYVQEMAENNAAAEQLVHRMLRNRSTESMVAVVVDGVSYVVSVKQGELPRPGANIDG